MRDKMDTKKAIFLILFLSLLVITISSVSALSNESITAKSLIDNATENICNMLSRQIPVGRANDSLQQAITAYNGQLALELDRRITNYKTAINYAKEVASIIDLAMKAQDEMQVFLETYNSAKMEVNLSEMDPEHNAVINSFNEQRFEDTPGLVEKAYKKLSEIQSKNTAINAFRNVVSRSFKKIILDHWKVILAWIIIIIIVLIIFWKTLKRIKIQVQIRNLTIRKDALYALIKKLQSDYFKTKKISETEYFSKLEKFKDMIRNIDRKLPLLKEQLLRVDKKKLNLLKKSTFKKK